MAIATVNPTTGVTECSFEPLTSEELETRLARASTGLTKLRNTSLEERTVLLDRLADILDDEVDRMAAIMTTEMGKTLASAKAEVRKCALGCRYYAKNAAAMLAAEPADATAVGAARAEVRYQPLGVVLAVMPWNFPAWQAIRFIAPALAAGNAVLLKHASNVPQSALLIEELVARAGFPEGAMQTLLITSDQVASVLRDERVAAATLTGSENAGRAVASLAGEQLKKMVLELGDRTLSSSCRRQTSNVPPKSLSPPERRTTVSPVSRQSVSSCTRTCTRRSRTRSCRGWRHCVSATPPTPRRRWAHSRAGPVSLR